MEDSFADYGPSGSPTGREELERSAAHHLWRASNAWQRMVRRTLAEFDLTHVQFVLLASVDIVGSEGELATQRRICRFADVDENMTSQVMRGLIEKGHVVRKPHPEDARAWQIDLTPSGRELLSKARESLRPAREAFFAPVADREAELIELLRQINAAEDGR